MAEGPFDEKRLHKPRLRKQLKRCRNGLILSHRDLYLAEFQRRRKVKTESWPEFGEDLLTLVDKAYPLLDDEAQQQLALQRYLSQLDNEQASFSVKQVKPKTAVSGILECESYLVKPPMSCGANTPAQMESKDNRTMMDMMTQLMSRMDKIEKTFQQASARKGSAGRRPDEVVTGEQREVVCYRCGQEGHFARGVPVLRSRQIRETLGG